MAAKLEKIETSAHPKKGTADYALAEVMRELSTVCIGDSAAGLQGIVDHVYPTDAVEAQKFMDAVLRLRQASESVHQIAVGVGVANRQGARRT